MNELTAVLEKLDSLEQEKVNQPASVLDRQISVVRERARQLQAEQAAADAAQRKQLDAANIAEQIAALDVEIKSADAEISDLNWQIIRTGELKLKSAARLAQRNLMLQKRADLLQLQRRQNA
jgi:hypothetical protein